MPEMRQVGLTDLQYCKSCSFLIIKFARENYRNIRAIAKILSWKYVIRKPGLNIGCETKEGKYQE